MSVDLLCVGHAAYDVSMYLAEFPAENSKAEITEMAECGGGPAANAAYLASRWGVSSAFAGLVGDDRYGRQIRDEFLEVGTDVSLLELQPGHVTPFSVILVNTRSGTRTIVNRKASSAGFGLNKDARASMQPRVLLFDGHELKASLEALESWPDAISILDAGSVRPGTVELAGRVDYLVASERFARQITGENNLSDESRQREVLATMEDRFSTGVTVTLGERGLVTCTGGTFRRVPAFPAKVVDTTGAGDIFHGAFAYGCVRGWTFDECLRWASMAGALSVQGRGGRTSIPCLAEVKEALAHVD